MAQIQGGHCPWSKIQGGQPTTLTPPCRAPAYPIVFLCPFDECILVSATFVGAGSATAPLD